MVAAAPQMVLEQVFSTTSEHGHQRRETKRPPSSFPSMPPSYSSLILAWCLVPTAPSLQTNKPQLHNTKWVYTYSTHTHKMFTLRLVHPHSFLLSLLLVLSLVPSSCPFFLSFLLVPSYPSLLLPFLSPSPSWNLSCVIVWST